MKKLLALFVYGISIAAFAGEFNAERPSDGFTPNNGGAFCRTIIIPDLAGGYTNDSGLPFILGSVKASRPGTRLGTTNTLVITRLHTVAYGGVTSTVTDVLVYQGWTNVVTATIEPAFDWINTGDILTATNTTTNINVTINAGKK